jgi:hypothetical protein
MVVTPASEKAEVITKQIEMPSNPQDSLSEDGVPKKKKSKRKNKSKQKAA